MEKEDSLFSEKEERSFTSAASSSGAGIRYCNLNLKLNGI
jgi:hypothetical protein